MIRTGEKVETIMKRFAPQMAGAVLSYLFDKGISNVRQVTDKEIGNLEGNGLMTQDFVQSLVKTARAIAIQCDLYEDILPFIVCQLPNMCCQTEEVTVWKQDGDDAWNAMRDAFEDSIEQHWGYEWDEIDRLVLKAVVVDAERECE